MGLDQRPPAPPFLGVFVGGLLLASSCGSPPAGNAERPTAGGAGGALATAGGAAGLAAGASGLVGGSANGGDGGTSGSGASGKSAGAGQSGTSSSGGASGVSGGIGGAGMSGGVAGIAAGGTSDRAGEGGVSEAGGTHASGAGGAGGASVGTLGIGPEQLVITGVRGVASPLAGTTARLYNTGASAVTVTGVELTGGDASLFQINSPPTLPATIAAGDELTLTLGLLTSSAELPAAPAQNSGGTLLDTTLRVTLSAGSVEHALYGLVLTTATHEPTLGQMLATLGYELDVGAAQDNANPNTGGTATLPGVEAGTDEVAGALFQKAGTGDVTLTVVARFSPKGPMPFGWYPKGAPATRNVVGTMAQTSDAQTSDKARMVLPPLTGGTTFDPGAQTFGIWMYSDQVSQLYDTGGSAANGDYDYSEDAANTPSGVHRSKTYPLKDAAGTLVPDTFLLAVEEAANGDYQDYVLVLGNAKLAP